MCVCVYKCVSRSTDGFTVSDPLCDPTHMLQTRMCDFQLKLDEANILQGQTQQIHLKLILLAANS